VSGSENWETLDEGASEPELDATEAYYAKLRAQQERTKRATPDGGWGEVPGSKVRNGLPPSARARVEESETGWTDEGDY
jgi:protein regulator of cytokinesis 1